MKGGKSQYLSQTFTIRAILLQQHAKLQLYNY